MTPRVRGVGEVVWGKAGKAGEGYMWGRRGKLGKCLGGGGKECEGWGRGVGKGCEERRGRMGEAGESGVEEGCGGRRGKAGGRRVEAWGRGCVLPPYR